MACTTAAPPAGDDKRDCQRFWGNEQLWRVQYRLLTGDDERDRQRFRGNKRLWREQHQHQLPLLAGDDGDGLDRQRSGGTSNYGMYNDSSSLTI